ncbi:MAG: hypothetical protein AMJ63_00710 [Myxococcales bacterium SG8_38_1]|nr:MAG: hypothetical protein AMJ63_00710 [Myxococcales bacterium SG8_38_1]
MKGNGMMKLRAYPTYDEILAIEHAARGARAMELARLAVHAASKLKALTRQVAAAILPALDQTPAPATVSSYNHTVAPGTLASVMEELGASLPSELRTRYAEELATAARVAPAIDFGCAALDFAVCVVAGVFQGVAQGLRAGAWCLDAAARRLMPLH